MLGQGAVEVGRGAAGPIARALGCRVDRVAVHHGMDADFLQPGRKSRKPVVVAKEIRRVLNDGDIRLHLLRGRHDAIDVVAADLKAGNALILVGVDRGCWLGRQDGVLLLLVHAHPTHQVFRVVRVAVVARGPVGGDVTDLHVTSVPNAMAKLRRTLNLFRYTGCNRCSKGFWVHVPGKGSSVASEDRDLHHRGTENTEAVNEGGFGSGIRVNSFLRFPLRCPCSPWLISSAPAGLPAWVGKIQQRR